MSAWFPFPSQETVEKDFQLSFVKLDNMLHDYYTKSKEHEAFVNQIRSHIFGMVKAFTNLETLAQTVHQDNLKYEAKMMDLKHELLEGRRDLAVVEKESEVRLAQLHEATSGNTLRFDNLAEQQRMLVEREAWLQAQLDCAKKENSELRQDLIGAMKDLGGCKVTIKYMDKEIIGRIQQLQLMQQGLEKHPNTLTWNTIEAEISLNRHKAVIYAHSMRKKGEIKKCPYRRGMVRTVLLQRGPEGLGLSITGGADHRAPVIISAVIPGKPADRFGGLYVGDAILTCNQYDLRQMSHSEAVKCLSSCGDELVLKVAHVAGYDDEHQIERAPILEIDPIPEDKPRDEGLQRLQVGKFPRENSLGERSMGQTGDTLATKQGPSLDEVLVSKNSVRVVPANSIGGMSGTDITEPAKPFSYYYGGGDGGEEEATSPAIKVPAHFTEAAAPSPDGTESEVVSGLAAMAVSTNNVPYTADPAEIISEVEGAIGTAVNGSHS